MDIEVVMDEAGRMKPLTRLPLYWRVCLTNGLVFMAGTVVLLLSPASVSARVLVSEAIVLTVGLSIILVVNSLLLRRSLAPLDRLSRLMDTIDIENSLVPLPVDGTGQVQRLIDSFNAMLTRLEGERRASSARALAAQEAERHRIAQELHDEIGQGLTVVLLGLKQAIDRAPADVADELRLVQDAARSSLDEVRDVARRLRPGVLEDLGLISAIAALATDFSRHTGVHVQRRFAPGLPELSADSELVMYRVAQESLTNVARHGRAGTVHLLLTKQGAAVALQVEDDGQGTRGAAEGAGVKGMRERALLVGGTLTITAREGGGTIVRLVVPATMRRAGSSQTEERDDHDR